MIRAIKQSTGLLRLRSWVVAGMAALACVSTTSCATSSGSVANAQQKSELEILYGIDTQTLDACVALLSHMLSKERPGASCYIAFSAPNPRNSHGDPPPPEVFRMLKGTGLALQPSSLAILTEGPIRPTAGAGAMVVDAITGAPSGIYWVNVIKPARDKAAIIEGGCFRGPKTSWGYIAHMKLEGGRWVIGTQTSTWRT